MTQPKQASPKRRPQIPDDESGQPHRSDMGGPDDADHKRTTEDVSLPQVAQDVWVTNFIDRLAGLVRNIGARK
jgi:hypothetical protein